MADPVTLMLISAGTALASAGLGAAGTIAQGNAQYAAAKAEQKNLNQMAAEEVAVSSRNAAAKEREAKLLQSRGQAVAAASGGGATDPTVLDIVGGIARDANVQERDLLRTGQVKANDLVYKGKVGVSTARENRSISRILAGAQVAEGVSKAASAGASAYDSWRASNAPTAYDKYGLGLPTSNALTGRGWYEDGDYKI